MLAILISKTIDHHDHSDYQDHHDNHHKTQNDLNESGEGPPAAARHHVSVQAAQSTQCGLVTQLLGSKMIRFSRLNENKKKIFKCHG